MVLDEKFDPEMLEMDDVLVPIFWEKSMWSRNDGQIRVDTGYADWNQKMISDKSYGRGWFAHKPSFWNLSWDIMVGIILDSLIQV